MSWSGFNLHFSQAYWCWTYLLSYGELWWSVCLPVFKLGLSTTSAMGACHLPPQGLNQMLLQLCIFHTPDRSSGWRAEMCWGRNWRNRSSDRYFQEPILWAQVLYLLVSRKALKILHGDNCSSWLRATLFKKYVPGCMLSPFPQITCILTFPPCLFGAVSQSYLKCCLLGCSPHFTPNKT